MRKLYIFFISMLFVLGLKADFVDVNKAEDAAIKFLSLKGVVDDKQSALMFQFMKLD